MKYTKIGISTLFVAFMAYAVALTPAFAIQVSDNGSTAASAMTPATSDSGSTAAPATVSTGNTSAPATVSNGNTSAPATVSNGDTSVANIPSTVSNGNTSAPATVSNGNTSAPATVSNGNTSGTTVPGTTDNGTTAGGPVVTPPSNGGGSSNGGGNGGGAYNGGSSSGSSGYGFAGGTSGSSGLPTITNLANCSYLTTYMKMGGDNDASQVTKLQTFLKNSEKANVDINGTFDQKTFDAVSAFQAKYINDTMLPWGVTTPSGEVFYTTQKKINELYCKTTFSLTAEQLAAITAYKNGLTSGSTTNLDLSNGSTTINLDNGQTGTSTNVGLNGDHGQTASVGGVGATVGRFFGGVWNWVKWLFGVNKK